MKTMNFLKSLAAAAVMAAAMVSCTSEVEILNPENPSLNSRTITVNLVPETQTRTMLDADAKLRWQTGDEVSYFTFNGTDWSTSAKAEIDASTGKFTANVPTDATQIRVVYPAVDNGTDFSEDLYAVKKYQNYAVKELAEGEFFFDGKYLPMYTEPTTIPTGEQDVDATYKVNGAVVKLHLTYPKNSENNMHIKGVRLGNYQFGFPKGMYKITNETACDVCVVVPINESFNYRPFVTAQWETYSYGNWEYYNYTYSYPSDKTATFSPKAYSLNFDLTTVPRANTYKNWAICFGDETNDIPTDKADNYFNINNWTSSSGATLGSYTWNDSWYQMYLNSGSKATYKIHNTMNTAYKIDLVFIGYGGGRYKATIKTDTEIVDESHVVTPGSNSFTTNYSRSYYLLDKLPVGDYTFEIECESPGAYIFGFNFQPIEPAFIDIPVTSEIWPSEILYRSNCKVAGGIGNKDERFEELAKYTKIFIPVHTSQSSDYTVSFNASTNSDGIVATATVVDADDYQTVGTTHNVNIANNGTNLSEYSFNTGELSPGNYYLVFTFNGDISQFRHIQIKDNVAEVVYNSDGKSGTLGGYEWVDLGVRINEGGIQKRLVFATKNIGAENPGDAGLYFWWGDIEGHAVDGEKTVGGYEFNGNNATSYNNNDPEYVYGAYLNPERDAAIKKWGNGWRMMSVNEFNALKSSTTYDSPVLYDNTVSGISYTGQGDYSGKSIFLPLTGRVSEQTLYFPEELFYWLTTTCNAKNSPMLKLGNEVGNYYKYFGCPIRPVAVLPAE